MDEPSYIAWFDTLRMTDVSRVGGKNASLGEMISQLTGMGVRVPGGFATTADAYRDFLVQDGLAQRIEQTLAELDIEDVQALAAVGARIRSWIVQASFPSRLETEISVAYEKMLREAEGEISVAVRSSATAEDLADASFAGQQETYLNVQGLDNLLKAVKDVFASLYNDRAISY
jgi:pyruvate,water dikinase